MKKILVLILLVTLLLPNTVMANEIRDVKIPGVMNPNAVIEFGDNLEIIIIEPGKNLRNQSIQVPYEELDLSLMSDYEKNQYYEEKKMIKDVKESVRNIPIKREEIFPKVGMKVVYDGEGFIKNIIYPSAARAYNPLPRGTTSSIGTYVWGKNNNELVVNQYNNVIGTGRFTVFTDTIGESSNTLKKGDCATRGDYDNPKHGQEINTRRLNNDLSDTNYTHIFYKRDNGQLPDAILDIWKTGVEYLGLTYSSTLSFKGRYFYKAS